MIGTQTLEPARRDWLRRHLKREHAILRIQRTLPLFAAGELVGLADYLERRLLTRASGTVRARRQTMENRQPT
jgi:hypothetical protein